MKYFKFHIRDVPIFNEHLVCMCLLCVAASAVVYDSVDPSPHYENTPNDLYIDERELIELPAPNQQDTN